MKSCNFTFETLVDFYEGRLAPEEGAQIQAHLDSGCVACVGTLTRIKLSVNAMREVGRVKVSEAAVERAYAIFQERFRPVERPSLLARLAFDSRVTFGLAGSRGNTHTAFHRLYITAEDSIDLWEEVDETGAFYLICQVTYSHDEAIQIPEQAILIAQSGDAFPAMEQGDEFHFASVPAGVYRLTLQLPHKEIVVPDIVVGE